MTGLFIQQDYNNVLFSNMRSFARFGLLILNKGIWANDTILKSRLAFEGMTNTSNNLNKSYGYLWWLNGKESYMLPETQIVFPGYLFPDAPAGTIAALGKNGQIVNIVEEENLVVVRIGEVPGTPLPIATVLNNDIWKKLNPVIHPVSSVKDEKFDELDFLLFPSPNLGTVNIKTDLKEYGIKIFNIKGEEVFSGNNLTKFNLKEPSGVYIAIIETGNKTKRIKFVLINR
ncbi:MAG: T9SS type A sorting domain-containing protein [Ignavibacteriaceae bacterium]|nr:T9SS type A sorting domain-containing protein [Ignavibacteriaceae bacterium]